MASRWWISRQAPQRGNASHGESPLGRSDTHLPFSTGERRFEGYPQQFGGMVNIWFGPRLPIAERIIIPNRPRRPSHGFLGSQKVCAAGIAGSEYLEPKQLGFSDITTKAFQPV